MARRATTRPTDGQLEILKVLWDIGPAELGQVCSSLRTRRTVATTTVATMLGGMLERGLVRRDSGPRGYRWSAAVSRKKTSTNLLRELIDVAFEGSAHLLVSHLMEHGTLSARDRKEIRRLLEAGPGAARRKGGDE